MDPAQVVDSGKVFLGYGVVGAVAIIEAAVIAVLYRANGKCNAELVAAWKSLAELVALFKITVSDLVTSSDVRARASEALARAVELAAGVQANLINELANVKAELIALRANFHELRTSFNDLRVENQRLREVILQMERSK